MPVIDMDPCPDCGMLGSHDAVCPRKVRAPKPAAPDPMEGTLIARLYRAVKNRCPCACEYERNAVGVPTWYPCPEGGIQRKLVQQCVGCALVAEYEGIFGAPADD